MATSGGPADGGQRGADPVDLPGRGRPNGGGVRHRRVPPPTRPRGAAPVPGGVGVAVEQPFRWSRRCGGVPAFGWSRCFEWIGCSGARRLHRRGRAAGGGARWSGDRAARLSGGASRVTSAFDLETAPGRVRALILQQVRGGGRSLRPTSGWRPTCSGPPGGRGAGARRGGGRGGRRTRPRGGWWSNDSKGRRSPGGSCGTGSSPTRPRPDRPDGPGPGRHPLPRSGFGAPGCRRPIPSATRSTSSTPSTRRDRSSSWGCGGWPGTHRRRTSRWWSTVITGWATSWSTGAASAESLTGSWPMSGTLRRTSGGCAPGPGGSVVVVGSADSAGSRCSWPPTPAPADGVESTGSGVGGVRRHQMGGDLPAADVDPPERRHPVGGAGRHRATGLRERVGSAGPDGGGRARAVGPGSDVQPGGAGGSGGAPGRPP